MRKCNVVGCDKKYHAKGFCNNHYQRFLRTNNTNVVTREQLLREVTYDPDTGVMKYIKKKKGRRSMVCGAYRTNGYPQCQIDYKRYRVHRLAWLYVYGENPVEIDHINGIRHDNRIVNLRLVTRSENLKNLKLRMTNKSGLHGVYFDKRIQKFQVTISDKFLGIFVDFFEACCCRKSAESSRGYHLNHGRTGETK